MIPCGDPSASYQANKSEIDLAIKRVLNSGWYVLGTEVDAFEKEFASFHGIGSIGHSYGMKILAVERYEFLFKRVDFTT